MENLFSGMWKVRELADKVTNVVMNYTEVEAKVREATNEEPWGPTGQIMQELAHSTFTYEHFPEVMSMLWKRMLQDNKQHWRRTYKSLLVLNYLIKNGSERVVTSAREHIYDLRSLENYTYIDDVGKDQGVNIRHKVKELIDFVQDDDRLREERKKAKKNKDKFIGMSSDTFGSRFGGTGHDTWDDRPYSKEYDEWDDTSNSTNRYRDKSFEEDNDLEKDDSDPETRNNSYNNNFKKFEDTEQPQSPVHMDKRVNININTSLNSSPKKPNKPLKKVDLGAAANFGRDASQSPVPSTGSNLLNDDFNPRAVESSIDVKAPTEFGDFETAFGDTSNMTQQKETNFADFNSAFSQSQNNTSQYSNLLGSTPNVVPNVIPPTNFLITNPTQDNLLGGSTTNIGGAVLGGSFPQKSNSDLLGDIDFGSLSLQPQSQNNDNFGFLGNSNNDLISGDTKKYPVSQKSTMKKRIEKDLVKLLTNFVIRVERIEKIKSQDEVEDILQEIERIVFLLPGPLTVQKLIGIDDDSYSEIVEGPYVFFLETLITYFDENFPFRDNYIYETIEKLLCVENYFFFNLNLSVFVKFLVSDKKEIIVKLLEIVLNSEGVFSYFFYYCLNFNEMNFENWEQNLNILITLPNRVSNCLKGNITNFFTTKSYTNFLITNFLKIIEFITEVINKQLLLADFITFENISLLLQKIVIDYNQRGESESIKLLIEIVALLTNTFSLKTKLYQKIITTIFSNMESTAVNILAKMILINLDSKKYSVTKIFGKQLIENDTWKFILCTKLPLLTNFDNNYTNLILNTTIYLSSTNHHLTIKLLLDLLTVWSNRSSIRQTSMEQQLFIARFILYLLNSIKNVHLNKNQVSKIKEKTFTGIQVHLESNIPVIRASGMKIGEIILNYIHKESESSPDTELKFNYDNLNEESQSIVYNLQKIWDKDLQDYYKLKHIENNIQEVLKKLLEKNTEEVEYIPPKRVFRTLKNEVTLSEYKNTDKMKIITSTDFDSDDDLQPYDVSNDTKITNKNPPCYLRDLKQMLLETDDVDVFTISLETCEKIIMSQLPDDDASMGLEILEILVSLEPKFYVENYDDLVFNSSVAITTVYPICYTEYLCRQIHSDVGTFSVSKRVFMLNILRQAARNLSVIKKETEPKSNKTKREIDIESVEEIIKKRLESKTRYFTKYKPVIKEQVNKFSEVARYFFFPLLFGYNKNKMLCQDSQNDSDYIFLIHFIDTLSILMYSSQNCPVAPRMAKEIFHFSWFLRFHKETKVRMAVLSLITSAVVSVNKNILIQDFLTELFEIRLWLSDLLSPNVSKGEPNSECRNLAAYAIILIEGVLKLDINPDNN
ncbi:telomere length regulation protein TEL2 homolog isoform X1 [Diorhabda sublineata]|uniref:telomere length regulation protein TEL2 homolog isoform X1 n=1 Tax=Diorhabda sublineata TaxID=1163346 RepID=UPI0024E12E28|nr:telomere length regulation protein TEL2 homolog isoform X1 [Diorhabda sublineata]